MLRQDAPDSCRSPLSHYGSSSFSSGSEPAHYNGLPSPAPLYPLQPDPYAPSPASYSNSYASHRHYSHQQQQMQPPLPPPLSQSQQQHYSVPPPPLHQYEQPGSMTPSHHSSTIPGQPYARYAPSGHVHHPNNYTLEPGSRSASIMDTPKSTMNTVPPISTSSTGHSMGMPPYHSAASSTTTSPSSATSPHHPLHFQQPPPPLHIQSQQQPMYGQPTHHHHPHMHHPSPTTPIIPGSPITQAGPQMISAHGPGSRGLSSSGGSMSSLSNGSASTLVSASGTAANSTTSGTAKKRRGNLPRQVTEILRQWLNAHIEHPYPTDEEKQELIKQTGLTLNQLSNWFINARRRRLPGLQNKSHAAAR